eukprot:TRINITY_DN2144_c0_g1_i4.p1 TRINITY_DN2144_c0_g1~~TRINITY_DN2144_c0_g1_i4.p1  ORF type:complete len:226 (-),score=81.75 TRINITY_DN2144_c0_g1_i4:202-879(-)
MLALAIETVEIADATNVELYRQVDVLKSNQQDLAHVHDMLNRSEKDMTAIKSFWGGLMNIGNKKKDDQHKKLHEKWETEFDKDSRIQAQRMEKQQIQERKDAIKSNRELVSNTIKEEKKAINEAKKESKAMVKDIKKGRDELDEGFVVGGEFVFETRRDGLGEKCAAEAGLDELKQYTSGLVDRALVARGAIRETQVRAEKVGADVERADVRLEGLNRRGMSYAR